MKTFLRIYFTSICLFSVLFTSVYADGISGTDGQDQYVGKSQKTAERDTVGWTVYNTSNSGLPSNWVQSIAIDDNDCIWIGTDYCGLVKFDESKNEWSAWNTSNCAIPSNIVEDVEIDSKGNTWVATYGGLASFDGQEWNVWNKSTFPDWPVDHILCMAIDTSGTKWLGTRGTMIEFNDTTWYSHGGGWIVTIAISGYDTKWIGNYHTGIKRFNDQDSLWYSYRSADSGLPDDTVRCITVGHGGWIWIGTDDHGLAQFNGGGTWYVYDYHNSNLPSNDVEALAVDDNGNIWIGFGFGGLAMYNHRQFTFYSTANSGLPDGMVECFAFDSKGRTWIGTRNGGLAVFDDATGLENPDPSYQMMPEQCVLYQNFPNPFNPSTVISYKLKVSSYTDLSIFNIIGQKVTTLVSEKQPAGSYEVEWDASGFASGVYFCRLSTDQGFIQTMKLVLMR